MGYKTFTDSDAVFVLDRNICWPISTAAQHCHRGACSPCRQLQSVLQQGSCTTECTGEDEDKEAKDEQEEDEL